MKTLKDIEKIEHPAEDSLWFVSEKELKEEVVKWVREYDRLVKVALRAGSVDMGRQYLAIKYEFMKFFNLTKEDLE